MSSHLGEYIQSQRKAAGLRIVEVARLAGLRDKPKMLRRLEGLERTGNTEPEIFAAVAQVLKLDPQKMEEAHQQDVDEYEKWLDEPIPRELVVRVFAAFYLTHKVPDGLSREEAIEWALGEARKEKTVKMCLRLSRRERVWINEGGESHQIETTEGSTNAAAPYMTINGKRFQIKASDPLAKDLPIVP